MRLIVHVEHSSAFSSSIRAPERFFIAKYHAALAFGLTVFIHRCEYLPTQNTFVGICGSPFFPATRSTAVSMSNFALNDEEA